MPLHEEFDYASGGLLDDTYVAAPSKKLTAPSNDDSPPKDNDARHSPQYKQPIRKKRIIQGADDGRPLQDDEQRVHVVTRPIPLPMVNPTNDPPQTTLALRNIPPPQLQDVSSNTVAVNSPLKTTSRVVLAIDYGTTYTGCAVATTDSGHADLSKIQVLQSWQGGNQHKVRTIISYANSAKGEFEWGSNISDGNPAMVNTKLELEPQSSRFDELELTWYLLKGTGNLAFEHLKKLGSNPAYTSKPPGEIVQDYLAHICESACKPKSFPSIALANASQNNTPMDIVVTVPANWSFQATDATFKAMRGAGFNKKTFPNLRDTILVSEPEAAAHFAIRDHQATTKVDLRPEDCFIVCDAGGGTVDVVSYQVKKVHPHLELERATEPNSDKCGSAFIDTAFKTWLRDILGPETYMKLDPLNGRDRLSVHATESGPMRQLVQDFIGKKHIFSEDSIDMKLDLPHPLDKLDIDGRVRQGELTIHRDELEDMFSECVNGVIELIDEQIDKLRERKNRKARNVFLVGGFGASPWLQEQLKESLEDLRGSSLRRPNKDKSITAVVQGAVIYGVEKTRHKDVKYMSAVTDSYGILIEGRFEWLVRKGDLVLSTTKRTIQSKFFSVSWKTCPSWKYELGLYHYIKRDDDDDDVPTLWADGQHDVEKVGVARCDFTDILSRDHRSPSESTKIGPLSCHLELSETSLTMEVLYKKTVLRDTYTEISIQTDAQRATIGRTNSDWRRE